VLERAGASALSGRCERRRLEVQRRQGPGSAFFLQQITERLPPHSCVRLHSSDGVAAWSDRDGRLAAATAAWLALVGTRISNRPTTRVGSAAVWKSQ
jgi:hypothetical protein